MTIAQDYFGVDVDKDWIDIHVLSIGAQRRIPTEPKALAAFAREAAAKGALVVFEASGSRAFSLCEKRCLPSDFAVGETQGRI